MTYAYPTNVSSLVGIAIWTNQVTQNLFWPLILFALFCILFFSFMNYGATRAFGASSFITMIISILMGIIGLVSSYVWVGCIIVAAIAMVCLYASEHKEY
jgi:amino acid transporter